VTTNAKFKVPRYKVAEFCKRNRIRKLSLFGSALRKDFTSQSDIDILVEFEPGARVGMIRLAGLELELGEILGRRVDLNTVGFLSKYYRAQVLSEAEVQYDESRSGDRWDAEPACPWV
jgi:predicted nucleotidyltransferase